MLGSPHKGMYYTTFLAQLARKRATRSYMEIGIANGENLQQIRCETAIGIDPDFSLNYDVSVNKNDIHLYRMTSDSFFESSHCRLLNNLRLDLVFIDGMHLFEYALRDFYNAERLCHPQSMIALHDCIPLNAEMTERVHNPSGRIDKTRANWWTGDTWKMVALLKRHRHDLSIIGVNCPPTGLVLISKLDHGSTLLRNMYQQLLEEADGLVTSESSLNDYISKLGIIDSSTIL